jgi:hypothetical protein
LSTLTFHLGIFEIGFNTCKTNTFPRTCAMMRSTLSLGDSYHNSRGSKSLHPMVKDNSMRNYSSKHFYFLLGSLYILETKRPSMSRNFYLHQGRPVDIESLGNQPQGLVRGSEYWTWRLLIMKSPL